MSHDTNEHIFISGCPEKCLDKGKSSFNGRPNEKILNECSNDIQMHRLLQELIEAVNVQEVAAVHEPSSAGWKKKGRNNCGFES